MDLPLKGLTPSQRKSVIAILKKFVPDCEVRAFGSRVQGTHKKYSDLDLALISDKSIPIRTMALLKEAFSESDLPFKVDLVDWAMISEEFRKVIEEKGSPTQILESKKRG